MKRRIVSCLTLETQTGTDGESLDYCEALTQLVTRGDQGHFKKPRLPESHSPNTLHHFIIHVDENVSRSEFIQTVQLFRNIKEKKFVFQIK